MTTTPNTKLELEFVSTFVVRPKRARYSGFVVSPRLRPKFLAVLHSFPDFDPRLKVRLSRSEDSIRGYLTELRRRGAGPNAYLISSNHELDGVTIPLDDSIREVHGRRDGTIVVCTASLAYYEGEWGYRFILDSRLLRGARVSATAIVINPLARLCPVEHGRPRRVKSRKDLRIPPAADK